MTEQERKNRALAWWRGHSVAHKDYINAFRVEAEESRFASWTTTMILTSDAAIYAIYEHFKSEGV